MRAITNPDAIELFNLGRYGVVQDTKPHILPPEAWSSGQNVRFNKNGVERFLGHASAFGALSTTPYYIIGVPAPGNNFWIYTSLTKAYVFDGTTHTNITRQTASVDVNYTPTQGRAWQGTILGGVPILNNFADLPQYWTGLSSGNKLANLTGFPSNLRAKLIKAFGPYLIAFNLIDTGTVLSKTLQWSSFADPGTLPASWDYTDPTVDTGRLQLTDDKGGEILDALLLGNQMVIYTTSSTMVLRYVGGTGIFAPDLLLKESGILAANCVSAFNKGTSHLVLTSDDVIAHQGQKEVISIVEDKDRKALFSSLDPEHYANSFVFENSRNKEVWVCYPSSGNTYPNIAMVWSYLDNTITFRDINFNRADYGSVNDVTSGPWNTDTETWEQDANPWSTEARNVVIAVSSANSLAYQIDSGQLYGTVAPTSFVERVGVAIDGKARDGTPKTSLKTVKQLNRIWPKVVGSAVLTVRVGSQETVDGPVTWNAPQSFNPATMDYLDVLTVGKLLAYRFESASATPWILQGLDLEIRVLSSL